MAAGLFTDIGEAVRATRPGDARVYEPDPIAGGVYDRVYAIYRRLYAMLGDSQVELLHELKAIRTDTRRRQS